MIFSVDGVVINAYCCIVLIDGKTFWFTLISHSTHVRLQFTKIIYMSLCQIPLEASKHILSREGFRDLIVSWCIFSYNRGALKKMTDFSIFLNHLSPIGNYFTHFGVMYVPNQPSLNLKSTCFHSLAKCANLCQQMTN